MEDEDAFGTQGRKTRRHAEGQEKVVRGMVFNWCRMVSLLVNPSVTYSLTWEEGLRAVSTMLPAHTMEAGALVGQGEGFPV